MPAGNAPLREPCHDDAAGTVEFALNFDVVSIV